MNTVHFVIPGEPKGKGRPRFARQGSFVRTYTPEETMNYEDHVRNEYRAVANGLTFPGEVRMMINCYFGIPKSTSKKKAVLMAEGIIRPTKKPDADNVAKIVADALNNVAYKDDTQITELTVRRWYTDEFARVEVSIVGCLLWVQSLGTIVLQKVFISNSVYIYPPNKYGYQINLNHPKVNELYRRYLKWKGIPQWCPLSDAQRFEFEAYVFGKIRKETENNDAQQ